MKKLRCCVIDDEPLANQLITGYVNRTPSLELAGSFSSAQEAVRTVLDGEVDLVFLDIQMPQLNGLEFARIIPPGCRVVFITAFEQYAVQGFKVNALDYLLKPVSYDDFLSSVNRAMQWHDMRRAAAGLGDDPRYIMVKTDYKLMQIPLDDILFIEGLKDYVKIYLAQDNRSVMTLMGMRTLEQYLPPSMFMRVHRSYMVNLSRIRLIERNRVIFGTHQVPVSESYRAAFNDYIARHSVAPARDDADD